MPPVSVPYIPIDITVHLGSPSSSAQNVTLPFVDYIKNVASGEIYPTWNPSALRANILAQVSYALNRIYTEYYRSRGYDFDITSTTALDQSFEYGRTTFENIDALVDDLFNDYIRRQGFIEPLAAKYCNGTTTVCDGLSQWGSEELATQGYNSLQILYNYYGNDIEIVPDAPVVSPGESYPGVAIRLGDSGSYVSVIQTELNRISQNYPLIPKLDVDGVFGERTEEAVRVFQRTFNLTADGVVGKATWYKLISIYVGITKLNELESEGQTLFHATLEYPDAIAIGDKGKKVYITQYFLSVLSDFYPSVPDVTVDGIFGVGTKNSVIAFQRVFGLNPNGIVDNLTWDKLYDAFRGVVNSVFSDRDVFAYDTATTPNDLIRYGDSAPDVIHLQRFLNAISGDENTRLNLTGTFDRKTANKLNALLSANNRRPTGVMDRDTWNFVKNKYRDAVSQYTSREFQVPYRVLRLNDTDQYWEEI